MLLGGSLQSDKSFKKILSIGYEFETSGISKLCLHSNRKTFINSDLALRTLDEKLERKSAKIVDNNYISVGIPIGTDISRVDSVESVEALEEDPDFSEMEEEEREYWMEEYKKDKEEKERLKKEKKYAKKENESFLDYFYENRKTDNKKVIKFQITNDLGKSDFEDMIKEHCQGLTIPKNDMFFFKTNSGKIFDIKFTEDIASNEFCESFSNVEYVITYFSPKKDNANIILDTFVDACSRIVDHLSNVQKIKGKLLIYKDDSKKELTTIGKIKDNRCLYHKPNTNLFYMDIYDDSETVKLQNLSHIHFIPQMTFKTKAEDTLDVIKEIVNSDDNYTYNSTLINYMELESETVASVEGIVDELIENFNQDAKKKIDITTLSGKRIKLYMFLIYYKLYQFIDNHVSIFNKTTYLKDYLTFSSRHSNFILYSRIKAILEEDYDVKEVNLVFSLFYDSVILEKLYQRDEDAEIEEDDYDEDGNYKYDFDAFEKELPESDPNFGNPLFSISSYFQHFEKKKIDWLRVSEWDIFSTTFVLKGDEVLLENRFFAAEMILYLQNTVDPRLSMGNEYTKNKMLTLRELDKIVNKLYGPKIKNMMNLEKNPLKNKLTLKCKSGYHRNLDFECISNSKAKTLKKAKTSKTVKTVKTSTSKKSSSKKL